MTSGAFVVIGLLLVGSALYHGMTARHMVNKILHGPAPHHGKHEMPKQHVTEYVTRDEFELYDIIKSICFFAFLAGVAILCTGKKGFMASRNQKQVFTKRVFKRSIFRMIFATIMLCCVHHYCKQAKRIVEQNKPHDKTKKHDTSVSFHFDDDEMMKSPEYKQGRNLHEIRVMRIKSMFGLDAENKCRELSTESACHTDKDCSWCVSAAVPSSCNTVADAKSLPAAVFQCDNLSEEEEIIEEPEEIEENDPCHGVYTDQSSCDADAACTWCKSAAVPSSCNTVENAKKLPPGVFACDAKEHNFIAMMRNAIKGSYHHKRAQESDDEEPLFMRHNKHGKKDRKGKHGKFGKHGKKDDHHKKKHCKAACFVKVLFFALLAFHMWTLHKLAKAQEAVVELGGTLKPKGCKKKGKKAKKPEIESSSHVLEYSICEHDFKDKEEFPVVEAPQVHSVPVSYVVEKPAHTME